MARFLFLQNVLFEYIGPMYISAMLKAKGHECDLLIISSKKDFLNQIKNYSPDAILISATTGPHIDYVEFIRKMKKEIDLPVLMGGPHPTFFPQILEEEAIDYICVGEGEKATVEFAEAIEGKRSFKDIANLGYKDENGKAVYNPVRNFIENLDEVPFADRTLYYKRYPDLARYPTKRFLTTRGCPYNCSFCYNYAYKELYKNKGRYVRSRSAENIIEEILEVKKKYPLKTVRFPDDSFTLDKEWLYDFLEKYKKEIDMPFTCLARANEVDDEETVKQLKEAGCINIFFGVESGNEEIRNKILCKALSDESIIKAASFLRKYKLPFGTYNMVGLPGETLKDCFSTIEMNQRIHSLYPTCSILQPYPKTTIASYAQQHGFLSENYDVDNFQGMISGTMIKSDHEREVRNLVSFFLVSTRFPALFPLIKKLIKLPPNPFYKLLAFASVSVVRLKSQNINFLEGLKLGLRFYKKYVK